MQCSPVLCFVQKLGWPKYYENLFEVSTTMFLPYWGHFSKKKNKKKEVCWINCIFGIFLPCNYSMSGHRVIPSTTSHFYAASKFAVTALTEGLRNELRQIKSNIRISVRKNLEKYTCTKWFNIEGTLKIFNFINISFVVFLVAYKSNNHK